MVDASPDGGGTPGPALRPVERYRLYEQLVRRLLDHIEEAGLVPGQQLPSERELAARLGVSRTSVRQALVALEVQGVVGRRHGGGTFLVSPDRHDTLAALRKRRQRLPDVLEAREALEVKIAELAALRRTDADLAAIASALDCMSEDIAEGGHGLTGDAQFHSAVAAAAHNPLLGEIMTQLADLITETRIESLTQPGRPQRSLASHRRIADAITAGDGRKAASAMRAHVRLVGRVMLLK
jgi:GntR family transcriptional repressor for pyruvate dehydrogenase complex